MTDDALRKLATQIKSGLTDSTPPRDALRALFGSRYHRRHFDQETARDVAIRDAVRGAQDEDDGKAVHYAGLIHPDNPPSGPYGGTSLVWFPTRAHGSLLAFVVGTRGLSPDEGILTSPGHRRRLLALRRSLTQHGITAWTKPDPADLRSPVPDLVTRSLPGFEHVFRRYGAVLYSIAHVPPDSAPDAALRTVQAFFDLYAHERRWEVYQSFKAESDELLERLHGDLFPRVTAENVHGLLRERHFVVLQGPPGTGKTRLAEEIKQRFFDGHGTTIQFHPAVTYEDFVIGLSPDPSGDSLRFDVRPGWLLQAAEAARSRSFLLVIDEVNRADLGKVLGEAIYLFEAGEIGKSQPRTVELAHALGGTRSFSLPEHLYVLGTMNTADRSIASIDLAIRRRFAFVSLYPDREVVAAQGLELATQTFDRLSQVFVEHVPQDGLELLPGHAYFLAKSQAELKNRFRYELLPLLDEYLREGLLGPANAELHAARDAIEDSLQ